MDEDRSCKQLKTHGVPGLEGDVPSASRLIESKIRRVLPNLLLSASVLLLLLAAGEVVCRLDAAKWRDAFSARLTSSRVTEAAPPPLIYRLRPSIPGLTNRAGYRDLERTRAKLPGRVRVAVIGDSVSMHQPIPFDSLYHQVMARVLDRQFQGRVEVLNFGVTGYDPFQEWVVFEQDTSTYNPDVVLWQLHDNDGVRTDFYTGRGRFYDRPASYLGRMFARRFDGVRRRYRVVASGLTAPSFEARHMIGRMGALLELFSSAAQTLEAQGIALVVVLYPRWPEGDEWSRYGPADRHLRRTIGAHFDRLGARVVDLLPVFEGHDPARLRFGPEDRWHPNEAGHRLISDAVAPVVKGTVLPYVTAVPTLGQAGDVH